MTGLHMLSRPRCACPIATAFHQAARLLPIPRNNRRFSCKSSNESLPRSAAASKPFACRAALKRSRRLDVKAIGFDFGEPEAESSGKSSAKTTKLSTLGTLSASLLVFGSVMRGAVGEAFLSAVAITIKYQATNKEVLAAYTKFYSLLLQAGFDSWEEYLIDQILLGRDNPLARSVAQGSVEDGAPVMRAVEYDLDVLQQLSVPMARLAEYIGESAPMGGPYWVAAGSSVAVKRPVNLLSSSSSAAHRGLNLNMPSTFIQRPATPDELRAWGSSITSKQEWSEAAPVLRQYYHLHGFGITSRNCALRWSKGAFEEGSEGLPNLASLSVLSSQREALAANTIRFCEGLPAQHCLIAGPSGSGKSSLLWESTLLAGKEKGLRIVDVPSSEQGALLEVARGAGRYPRIRFIIVVDNLDLPLRGSFAADVMAGLNGGSGSAGWPSNALLYVGASPTSTITYDHIVSRFGIVLTTATLTEEEFGTTLMELVESTEASSVPEEYVSEALRWAKARGGLTIRNAWLFVQHMLAVNFS